MEKSEEEKQVFPEGFKHVEDRLKETQERLQQIDDQIKNIPKEKGPIPVYTPPHFVGHVVPGSRDKTRVALEEMRHQIKIDALDKTDAETRDVDSKIGRTVRDIVREALFPNPIKTLSQEDRQDLKSLFKEIEQSQDSMDAMFNQKEKAVIDPQPIQTKPEQETKREQSLSERFSKSLSYTVTKTQYDYKETPARDRQKDMDRE